MEREVELLLEKAAGQPKGDWYVYNDIMRELRALRLPHEQREEAEQSIIEILNV